MVVVGFTGRPVGFACKPVEIIWIEVCIHKIELIPAWKEPVDEFLAACDYIDAELYDDYKDMYESEPWFMDLQEYTECLQRLTGKKPERQNRKWNYLGIETMQSQENT